MARSFTPSIEDIGAKIAAGFRLTTAEAAMYLGISTQVVWRLVRAGDLAASRVGGTKLLFDVKDIDAYLTSRLVTTGKAVKKGRKARRRA